MAAEPRLTVLCRAVPRSKIYFSMGVQSKKLCFPRLNAADMRQRYVRPRLSAADIWLSVVELGLSGV